MAVQSAALMVVPKAVLTAHRWADSMVARLVESTDVQRAEPTAHSSADLMVVQSAD
jgi:hypothetical protein